tara:strand:- start:8420 stop:8824 length:405 start_codon:yes stop_codon:yes gene_type:complete
MIKVVKKINRDKMKYGANLPMHYTDMVHFFGEPITINCDGTDRRVEWYVVEERDGEDDIRAIIYDSMLNDNVEDEFEFMVECHCDRSFEVVAEFINQERKKGKEFITQALEGQGEKKEAYEVSIDNQTENANDE